MSKRLSNTPGSLGAVRRELRRARLADVAAVRMALLRFWNPLTVWRAIVFLHRNQRRQRLLARMDRARMGFGWRCSLPKKQQRQLGLLPKLT